MDKEDVMGECTYIHIYIYKMRHSSTIKNEIIPFAAT